MSPKHQFIQKSNHPCNDGGIGDVEDVPFVAEGVEGEEIGNRPIEDAVDGVADSPADDEADANGDKLRGRPGEPNGERDGGGEGKQIRPQRPSSLRCWSIP